MSLKAQVSSLKTAQTSDFSLQVYKANPRAALLAPRPAQRGPERGRTVVPIVYSGSGHPELSLPAFAQCIPSREGCAPTGPTLVLCRAHPALTPERSCRQPATGGLRARERRREDVETQWRPCQISEGPEAQDAAPAADPGALESAPPAAARSQSARLVVSADQLSASRGRPSSTQRGCRVGTPGLAALLLPYTRPVCSVVQWTDFSVECPVAHVRQK